MPFILIWPVATVSILSLVPDLRSNFFTADFHAGHWNAGHDWSTSPKMPFPCQVLCNCIPQQVGHCLTARLSSLAASSPCPWQLPLVSSFSMTKRRLAESCNVKLQKIHFGGSGFSKTQYKILSFVVKIQGTTDGSHNWDLKPTTVYPLKVKQSHLWVLGQENSNVSNCFRKWITNICIGT